MKLQLRIRPKPDSDDLEEYIERRVRFCLSRFGNHVGRVLVTLQDTNGPKGGVDLLCRMVVKLRGSQEVVVEGRDHDIRSLVDRTADRLGHAVSREIDRRKIAATLLNRME